MFILLTRSMDGCSQEPGIREEPFGLSGPEVAQLPHPECFDERSQLRLSRSWDPRLHGKCCTAATYMYILETVCQSQIAKDDF